jgi:uncharacterized membrane protein
MSKPRPVSLPRTLARVGLGSIMMFAGVSHLTVARRAFRAQVPRWVPVKPDTTVLASGAAEIALGAALAFLPKKRVTVGWVAAAFYTAIFPGNVSQLRTHEDAFGLDTDRKRAVRLLGQPLLVGWALWSTAAFRDRRKR